MLEHFIVTGKQLTDDKIYSAQFRRFRPHAYSFQLLQDEPDRHHQQKLTPSCFSSLLGRGTLRM